jgi:hypothetical protein
MPVPPVSDEVIITTAETCAAISRMMPCSPTGSMPAGRSG